MSKFRKIKINTPEYLSSVNMCMSGVHVRIEYIKETESEYQYRFDTTGPSFMNNQFSIDKNIYNHGAINLGVSFRGKTYFFQTNLEMLKNRNEFLDWTVKKLENLCL
jgi:hypothetical protein